MRAQIRIEVLCHDRRRGIVNRLAGEYGVSRQTICHIGEATRAILIVGSDSLFLYDLSQQAKRDAET